MSQPKKIEWSAPVAIRFPKEDYRLLESKARETGLSVGVYIRSLVVPTLRRKRA